MLIKINKHAHIEGEMDDLFTICLTLAKSGIGMSVVLSVVLKTY